MCFLIVGQKISDEINLHGMHLQNEDNRWRKYWEEKQKRKQ